MKHSVIVPCYNHAKYIEDCINSIVQSGGIDLEIIAIDDNSQDGSRTILKGLAAKFNQLRVHYHDKNMGLVKTLQHGLELSTGDNISACASDDMFAADRFAIIDRSFSDDRNQIVYINGRYFNKDIQELVYRGDVVTAFQRGPGAVLHYLSTRVPCMLLQSITVRRSFLFDIGGFETGVELDDWPFHLRVFRRLINCPNHTFSYVNSVGFFYRIHDQNMHQNLEGMKRRILEVIDKCIDTEYKRPLRARVFWGFGNWHMHSAVGHFCAAIGFYFSSQRLKFTPGNIALMPFRFVIRLLARGWSMIGGVKGNRR